MKRIIHSTVPGVAREAHSRRKKKKDTLRKAGAYLKNVEAGASRRSPRGQQGYNFEEKTSRAEKLGIAAGGATMTAGYVKAARDRQLGKDFIEARNAKRAAIKKKIPDKSTFEDILDEDPETSVTEARKKRAAERKRLIDEWDIEQAKKHKVIAAQTTKSRDGKRVTSGRKGIRGSIVLKDGKAYARPSRLSQGLQILTGGRATLPKIFLKRNPFR